VSKRTIFSGTHAIFFGTHVVFQIFKISKSADFIRQNQKKWADFVRQNQRNVVAKKKRFSIQTLANCDYIGRNDMFHQTKLQKWISHTKGCKSYFCHTKGQQI